MAPHFLSILGSWWGRRSTASKGLLLGLLSLALYLPRLAVAPVHIVHDEVMFALNAHAIATTGMGLSGERWPLYFHIVGNFWATPYVVYLRALFLSVLPVSVGTIRLPTVLIGSLNVLLLYLLARRLFEREQPAIVAAALLAFTPAHLIESRLGVDHLYPVPFLLGALLCVLHFEAAGRWRYLAAAGFLLGAGVYSYVGAMAMMPCYLGLVGLCICVPHRRPTAACGVALAGFLLALLPLVPWVLSHPTQFGQQVDMYGLAGTNGATGSLRGLLRQFNYPSMVEHTRVYHEFFNPAFLFLSGDTSIISSTRTAGVFLLPMAPLLVVGVNHIINERRDRRTLLVLGSFLIAPLAAVMVGEVRISRELTLLPMAALIATYGVEWMLVGLGRWWRAAAAGLFVLGAVQFAYFYADYLGDYRIRSGRWFEDNRRGAFDLVLADLERNQAAPAYLSSAVPWMAEHWRLYLIERGRENFFGRTTMFNPERRDVNTLPADSAVVVGASLAVDDLELLRRVRRVTRVSELNGDLSFYVVSPAPVTTGTKR